MRAYRQLELPGSWSHHCDRGQRIWKLHRSRSEQHNILLVIKMIIFGVGIPLSFSSVQYSSAQLLSRALLFATSWTAAHEDSLSISNYQSLLKLMFIELVMPSNHLILCRPLLLLPSVFPRIRVFPNESVLRIKWPKYWSFSFTISASNEYLGLISFRIDWLDVLAVQGTLSRVFSSTTVQNHQFFSIQLSL